MRVIWWGGWPWKWRVRFVRRSKWGPFGELVLGPVGFTWYSEESEGPET
jgi:hypothetical protein